MDYRSLLCLKRQGRSIAPPCTRSLPLRAVVTAIASLLFFIPSDICATLCMPSCGSEFDRLSSDQTGDEVAWDAASAMQVHSLSASG